MRVTSGFFTKDGRFPGSYVYLFMCEYASTAIIKIGVSDTPMSRLNEIRIGCPFKASAFATINVPTRKIAFAIEAELLKKFEDWKTRGEWLCFPFEAKAVFNSTLQATFAPYRKPGWPLRIQKVKTAAMDESLPTQRRRHTGRYMSAERLFRELNERMGLKPFRGRT